MAQAALLEPLPGRRCLIYGLQRSGTHFLAKIMLYNLGAKSSNVALGQEHWKHTLTPPSPRQDTIAVAVVKDPWRWIESVAVRNSVDVRRTHKGRPLVGGQFTLGKWSVPGLTDLWVRWFEAWVVQADYPLVVNYASLLTDAGLEAFLDSAGDRMRWGRRAGALGRPLVVGQSETYDAARDDPYYLGGPLRALSDEYAMRVAGWIPDRLHEPMRKLGLPTEAPVHVRANT